MNEYVELLTIERGDRHVRLRSPAKINLFLEPIRKRDDGYHEIVTVMQTIDFCDEVAIELGGSALELECDRPDVPVGPENLAWRAAEAFAAAAGVDAAVRIRLRKRIPAGAGLGGGSSNAAVTLLGLNALHGSPLNQDQLAHLAASLGSDVPFFVYGGTALCTGRGERVEPLKPAPEFWAVLVMAPISISTATAYGRLKSCLTSHRSVYTMLQSINSGAVEGVFESLHNGLAGVVLAGCPALEELWKEVAEEGLPHVQLSGSGSTLYGVCCSGAEAAGVKRRLEQRLAEDVSVAAARSRLATHEESKQWRSPRLGSA